MVARLFARLEGKLFAFARLQREGARARVDSQNRPSKALQFRPTLATANSHLQRHERAVVLFDGDDKHRHLGFEIPEAADRAILAAELRALSRQEGQRFPFTGLDAELALCEIHRSDLPPSPHTGAGGFL